MMIIINVSSLNVNVSTYINRHGYRKKIIDFHDMFAS